MPLPENDLVCRDAAAADTAALARIYNHYVAETVVTFEEEAVSPGEMHRRIEEVQSVPLPWLVAEVDGNIAGFAYASKWKGRCAYRYTAEVTVYLDPGCKGRGIGSKLYRQLLSTLKDRNIHTVMGGIALPNEASIALHEKLGFEKVAHFREVGYKFDRWVDVGYWQRGLGTDRLK